MRNFDEGGCRVLLVVPSGACANRPLSASTVGQPGEDSATASNCAVSGSDKQGQAVSVQQSQGMFTVTSNRGQLVPRAIRGQVRVMRIGRSRREPDSQNVIPPYRIARQTDHRSVGLALPPTSRKLKNHSTNSEVSHVH